MKKLAVVALGGNAMQRGDEIGTIQQQEANTYKTCQNLIELIKNDVNLVISHGNGPQVGNILLRNEAGYNTYKIPKMPLDTCVADSQGGIGYMIERQMLNVLREHKIKKNVVTIVTQVIIDKKDPAFNDPTKPVGAFYMKEEADLLAKANNWVFKEDPRKRGWRRVVASPTPKDILNKKLIKDLAKKGTIVIAVGGGGIPVYYDDDKLLKGMDAVIDKDLASSLLAWEINADNFYILTDVPKVYINYNSPQQEALDHITVADAEKYFEDGHFAKGSMGPKIKAAINFTKHSKHQTIITESSQLNDPDCGTKILFE